MNPVAKLTGCGSGAGFFRRRWRNARSAKFASRRRCDDSRHWSLTAIAVRLGISGLAMWTPVAGRTSVLRGQIQSRHGPASALTRMAAPPRRRPSSANGRFEPAVGAIRRRSPPAIDFVEETIAAGSVNPGNHFIGQPVFARPSPRSRRCTAGTFQCPNWKSSPTDRDIAQVRRRAASTLPWNVTTMNCSGVSHYLQRERKDQTCRMSSAISGWFPAALFVRWSSRAGEMMVGLANSRRGSEG